MRAKIEIPNGWERLRCGAVVTMGDRILSRTYLEWSTPFEFGYKDNDDRSIGDHVGPDDYVIRRVKK
jgi:hypothetical protein